MKEFCALYILQSYVLTRRYGTIFLWLVGGPRSGKSTFQNIAENMGYRAFGGVDPTKASIYRTLGHDVEYGPMILIKEYERASVDMKKIAREGDVPGSTVDRADKVGAHSVVNQYYTYGSRVVASNVLHGNDADRDRYYVIQCMPLKSLKPRAELGTNQKVVEELSKLRNDLLLWKLGAYETLSFPTTDPKKEISQGRDWEHYGGIITLASMVDSEMGSAIEEHMRSLIKQYVSEAAEESKSSVASVLFRIVRNLADDKHLEGDTYRIPFREIWNGMLKVSKRSRKEDKIIAPDGTALTETMTGKKLKEELGGKAYDRWDGVEGRSVRFYVWTKNDMKALEESFTTLASSTV